MDKYKAQHLARWLSITNQQLDIMMSIYRLQAEGIETSPRNIEKRYINDYGESLQKSNLFGQIRSLVHKGLVIKERKGVYSVNLDAMDHLLNMKREELERELHEFNQIANEAREYFKKVSLSTIKHSVNFLNHAEFYKAIAASTKNASTIYSTAHFPTIAYPYTIARGLSRDDYVKVVWERCFEKRELEVKYLTSLDVDFPFNHAFRVYADPKNAYQEAGLIIDQLMNQVLSHPGLDIRYMEYPHCMDIFIPEKNEPKEFFLYTRDEHRNIIGGFHIRSAETAISVKEIFLRDFEYAEPLRGPKTNDIIRDMKEHLERKYGVIG